MNEEVKTLVVEHYQLGQKQGENLRSLARHNREFDKATDKRTWEGKYRSIRKDIDATRERLIAIEQELHKLAGCEV